MTTYQQNNGKVIDDKNDVRVNHNGAHPAAVGGDDDVALRLERIQEYRLEGLASPNKLVSNLSAVSADLFHLAVETKTLCDSVMARADLTPAELGQVRGEMLDDYLRVVKQAVRYVELVDKMSMRESCSPRTDLLSPVPIVRPPQATEAKKNSPNAKKMGSDTPAERRDKPAVVDL
jgi:hypothetical protein